MSDNSLLSIFHNIQNSSGHAGDNNSDQTLTDHDKSTEEVKKSSDQDNACKCATLNLQDFSCIMRCNMPSDDIYNEFCKKHPYKLPIDIGRKIDINIYYLDKNIKCLKGNTIIVSCNSSECSTASIEFRFKLEVTLKTRNQGEREDSECTYEENIEVQNSKEDMELCLMQINGLPPLSSRGTREITRDAMRKLWRNSMNIKQVCKESTVIPMLVLTYMSEVVTVPCSMIGIHACSRRQFRHMCQKNKETSIKRKHIFKNNSRQIIMRLFKLIQRKNKKIQEQKNKIDNLQKSLNQIKSKKNYHPLFPWLQQ